jgi:hypothetical protein
MRGTLLGLLLLSPLSAATAQSTWTVEKTPILDVAGVSRDGTLIFGYAAGGTRLSDGRLLIADRAENGIRVVDATGKLVRTVGRAGQGPGDFQAIRWAGRCGADSLLIWDAGRRQASMIGSTGSIARQFAIPTGDTAQSPFQFACSPRGAMSYLSSPRPVRGAMNSQMPNVAGLTAAVYRIRADGAIAERLGEIPAGEFVAITSPSGGRGGAPRPLGRAAFVAAMDDAMVISSADSAHVTIVRSDGRSSRHALPILPRAPTRAEFEEAVQATSSMAPPNMRQAMVEQLSAVPPPERLPAISALFVDSEGLVWVQTTPSGGKILDFLVMQGNGSVVARVQIPVGLTIFEIGRDYVLGSYNDASGEMHVATYRLRRQ